MFFNQFFFKYFLRKIFKKELGEQQQVQFFYLRKLKIYANKKIKGVITSSIFLNIFYEKYLKKN
jgi:hypothetical protein